MTNASATGRSPVGSDGRLSRWPSNATVVEPPESSANPVTQPRETSASERSMFVKPMLQPGLRPSAATITIPPSARWPIAVRGSRPFSWMFVSDSPECAIGWPSRTSAGPPPTAPLTVAQSGGSERRTFSGWPMDASDLNASSYFPRATSTAPFRGIGTLLRLTIDVTVPVRSINGTVGGNGANTAANAFSGGVDGPHAGVNSAVELVRGGSFSWPIGYVRPLNPCQTAVNGTRSTCSSPDESTPTAERFVAG